MNRLTFIAFRYLTSKKNFKFISNINYLSIIGLSIGVAVLIITMGVLNGFENEVKKKIISFDGHIRVSGYFNNPILQNSVQLDSIIDENKEIVDKIEFINHAATIRYKNQTEPVFLEAFNKIQNKNFFTLNKNLILGDFDLKSNSSIKGIVIGKVLYDRLNIKIGEKITLMDLKSLGNPGFAPRIIQFELRGVYETGLTEYDESIVYINLKDAQILLGYNNLITGYILSLNKIINTNKVGKILNDELKYPLTSSTWIERHSNLFQWLSLQKYPITIVFAMIALVGILNISSSLTMIVMEKTRSIGVMRAIGFSENDLAKIFFLKGIIIGFSGVIFGLIFSLSFGFLQTKFNILSIPQEVYFMGSLPFKIIPMNVLIIGSIAIIFSIFASVYPARMASKIQPSNAIRYE